MASKDYQNGKIYCIRNNVDDDIYVGSTCQPLSKRMAKHRESMTNREKKDRLLYTKMTDMGVDKFYIELIEEYPCDNLEQLRKREGHYIREMGTLNSLIAGRTKRDWTLENLEHVKALRKERYENNKEKALEANRAWREAHPEKMKEYKDKWYEANKEEQSLRSKERYQQNKDYISKRGKAYRESHTEQIKTAFDKWNVKVDCPCGGVYHKCKRNEHEKTRLHQYYVEHGMPKVYKNEIIQCACGGCYRGNRTRHEKSQQHQDYLKTQN